MVLFEFYKIIDKNEDLYSLQSVNENSLPTMIVGFTPKC